MKRQLKRRKYISGAEKIPTTIYLLPRHRGHLQFLMQATGLSMSACICNLIDQSLKTYRPTKKIGE